MVFAVSPGMIKIRTSTSGTEVFTPVSQVESVEMAFDNNIEEWTPLGQNGWMNRLKTGQSVTMTCSGKRDVGDPGNDYVNGLALKVGTEAYSVVQIDFTAVDPKLGIYTIPGVVNVTDMLGASTDVAALNWELVSNGEVTWAEGE